MQLERDYMMKIYQEIRERDLEQGDVQENADWLIKKTNELVKIMKEMNLDHSFISEISHIPTFIDRQRKWDEDVVSLSLKTQQKSINYTFNSNYYWLRQLT